MADGVTAISIDRFEAYEPSEPVDVAIRVTHNDAPFEGHGTLRLIDEHGAEAYSGPLGDMSLPLQHGRFRALVNVEPDAQAPAWTRGAAVIVGDEEVVIPLESGRLVLEGEGRANLLNRETGVAMETTLPADLPAVAGTYEVTLVRDAGSARQAPVDVTLGEQTRVSLDAEEASAEGEVRVDGELVAVGTVVFHDPETGHDVRVPIREGTYRTTLVNRAWAVFLDTRDVEGPLPQMRALTHEAAAPIVGLDLDVSTVSLRGTYSVDGVAAPVLGQRYGFVQVVDALGIAGAGVPLEDGTFEGRIYATRASLDFVGMHSTAPRLAQRVAESLVLDDVPIEVDIETAQLEVALRVNGGTFPLGADIVPRGRGVLMVRDDSRSLEALFPPRGEAIATMVVPPGRYTLLYANDALDEVPRGQIVLGEVEVSGETRVDYDLTLHEFALQLPPDAGRAQFTGIDDGSFVDTNVTGSTPGTVRLFGGTWRLHELCTVGCGRLVMGWFSL